jgi:hypothetical protein
LDIQENGLGALNFLSLFFFFAFMTFTVLQSSSSCVAMVGITVTLASDGGHLVARSRLLGVGGWAAGGPVEVV